MGRVKAKHIAIMAHSYGGVVTVSLVMMTFDFKLVSLMSF